jgi:hypothetical protein
MEKIRNSPAGSLTAEQMYATGMYPDMETARYRERYNNLIRELGGSWENGVLTPPPGWGGTVTEFSKYISSLLGTPPGGTAAEPLLTAPETIEPIEGINPEGDEGDGSWWGEFWNPDGTNNDEGGFGVGDTTTIPNTSPWSDYDVGSPKWIEYVYGREHPEYGYLAGLGLLGKEGRTPYQSYLENLYGPLSRLYDLSSKFATAGMGQSPGDTLAGYSTPFTQNPFAMFQQAKSMLGQTTGMTPEQRASLGLQGPTAALQDLMGMGLRGSLGIPGATWLANRLPQEEEQWVAKYPQQQGPSFMDYLVQKYNLGQYFGQ